MQQSTAGGRWYIHDLAGAKTCGIQHLVILRHGVSIAGWCVGQHHQRNEAAASNVFESDRNAVRGNIDAEAPDPSVSALYVERCCPDRNHGLTKTASVHGGIQSQDCDVRSKPRRPGIRKLEAFHVATLPPGECVERLSARPKVIAEISMN
jgi:hypothetical protein